uniref:Pentraxin (PTX) domain-containing protein n=1 Tax=Felis catus TaxID=9685 RepID=A0ABI7ZR27_FELCA
MPAGRAARTCALLALCLLGGAAQDFGPTRFICTSVPVDADMCAASVAAGGAEELRSNVLQLRETVLQQKETILSQKETIRELTTKLGRCESQSTLDAGTGEARAGGGGGGGGRKQPGSGKNTMGDLSRTPAAETLSQLGQTLQSLKTRLENLEQYSRLNSSSQTNSLKDLLQSKIDDLERQVLSRVNTLEEGKGGPRNDTEERVKIESALTSLHQRISELEKGQKDNRPGDKFQLTFPLRTNYMYAKVKKSLPEMYAFTVCMWLKSSAAPGVGTPFSYAVPGQANELVLIEWGNNPMEILINDKVAKLPFVINDGKWHHICVTWTTRDGVWEAYQDGTQGGNGENLAPYHPIKPQGVLVLGQEQERLRPSPSHALARSLVCPCAREAGPAVPPPRSPRPGPQACSCSRGRGVDVGERACVSTGVCLWGRARWSVCCGENLTTGQKTLVAARGPPWVARVASSTHALVFVCKPFPGAQFSTGKINVFWWFVCSGPGPSPQRISLLS